MTGEDRSPLDRVHFALGGLALVLAILAVGFVIANASLQKTAAAGQAKIASAQTAANLNNSLIRMLAKSAAENNDPALKTLLAENGITLSEAKPAAPTPSPAQ